MKFRYLYILPILGTALMGCDEIEMSDAKPVENPQLPSITQNDFTVTAESALSGLNLEALNAATDDPTTYMVPLYRVTVLTEALPESAVISGGIEFSVDDTFENPFNLGDVTIEDGVVSVPLSSLIYTRSTMFGKDPRPYDVYYRIPLYVTLDGGQYKLGDKDFYYNDGDSFVEEGVDPGYTVEEAYYILGPNGTTLNTATKFNHSGYNIYDDTIFTCSVEFGETETSWIIVPLSAYEAANGGTPDAAACYGPKDAESLKGVLELGGKAGKLQSDTKYNFSINLSTLEYTIEEVANFDYLYTPGNSNGWNQAASQMLTTSDYKNYSGYVYLDGEFKFTSQENWDGINYGAGEEEGTLSTDGGNLTAEAGLYWASVNISELKYTLTPITTIGLIGDATAGDWNESTAMTASDDDMLTWTVTTTLSEGSFKFRANDGWDINLGAAGDVEPSTDYSDLVQNGKNLASPGAGSYVITLDLSKLPYSCKVEAAK